jgi:hypothetical protein
MWKAQTVLIRKLKNGSGLVRSRLAPQQVAVKVVNLHRALVDLAAVPIADQGLQEHLAKVVLVLAVD